MHSHCYGYEVAWLPQTLHARLMSDARLYAIHHKAALLCCCSCFIILVVSVLSSLANTTAAAAGNDAVSLYIVLYVSF